MFRVNDNPPASRPQWSIILSMIPSPHLSHRTRRHQSFDDFKMLTTNHHPLHLQSYIITKMVQLQPQDFISSYAIFTTLLSLLSFLLLRTFLSSTRRSRLPPSPFALPVLGHLHLLTPIPHQALHRLALRYGPLFSLRLGSVPCIVASSADTARDFLKTHDLAFSDRPVSLAVARLTYGSADFSFAPYGPYWRFLKKLCMSELLGGRTLDLLLPVRRQETLGLLRSFRDADVAVDVGAELVKFTNNVISRMTMSRRCTERDGGAEEVRMLVKEVAELTGKFNLADYISICKNMDLQGFNKRLKDVHARFDVMMEGIMKEKEEAICGGDSGEVKDFLDILMKISRDEGAEMKLTRENIKAFILDIFIAGTDTSAITIEWALSELINHPAELQRAREEIDAVVGKSRIVEESDIPNLPYLQAVVTETLRLHPTGPMIVRESNKDCKVGNYEIPARTTLFVNVWAIGRDPEHWPEPLEFRPERFLQSALDIRGQHYQLLPFGSGRRSCPGTSLAMQVVQPTLAAMIQCFEWKVSGGGTVDMAEGLGLTLPRAHPLVCMPVSRLDPMPLL